MAGLHSLVSEGLILFLFLLNWLGMATGAGRERRAGVETFGSRLRLACSLVCLRPARLPRLQQSEVVIFLPQNLPRKRGCLQNNGDGKAPRISRALMDFVCCVRHVVGARD